MTRIANLPLQTSALTSSDEFPIAPAGQSGASYRASLGQFLALLRSTFTSPEFTTTISAPTASGWTVNLTSSVGNQWVIVNGNEAASAGGTIQLPSPPVDGQTVMLSAGNAMAFGDLDFTGGDVVGVVEQLLTGSSLALRYSSQSEAWHCVSIAATGFGQLAIETAILDADGNIVLGLSGGGTALVNHVSVANALTGVAPSVAAEGDDTNINLNLVPKGTGVVQAAGVPVATTTDTQTLSNKTLNTPTIGVLLATPLTLANLQTTSTLLGNPPGLRGMCSNSSVTVFRDVIVGAGATLVPAFFDGTNWRVG